MIYRKSVTENREKRIIFISFYLYEKDKEGTLRVKPKRKQCAACFALSPILSLASLASLLLAYRVFPPPAGAVYCVCGLRAENHMLFVLFVAAAAAVVVHNNSYNMLRDNKCLQLFTACFCRFFAKKI